MIKLVPLPISSSEQKCIFFYKNVVLMINLNWVSLDKGRAEWLETRFLMARFVSVVGIDVLGIAPYKVKFIYLESVYSMVF